MCRFVFSLFGVALFLLILNSCASLSYENMIPDYKVFENGTKSINIIVLKGNIVDNGDAEFYENNVDDELLKKAFMKSLDSSKIFKKVTTNEDADFNLTIKNIKHNVSSSYDMTAHSLITISYKLNDNLSNVTLWNEDITTSSSCTLKEAYNTFTRHNTATEKAIKKNFIKSIETISKRVKMGNFVLHDATTIFCNNWSKLRIGMSYEEVAQTLSYPAGMFSQCTVSNEVIFVNHPEEFEQTKNFEHNDSFFLFDNGLSVYNFTGLSIYQFSNQPCFFKFIDCKLSEFSHNADCLE